MAAHTEVAARVRLQRCRQLLLDFEGRMVKAPSRLGDALSAFRKIVDQAPGPLEELLKERRELGLASEGERHYLNVSSDITRYVELLTDGTYDPDLPYDLVDLLPGIPADVCVILRLTDAETYRTDPIHGIMGQFSRKIGNALSVAWSPQLLVFIEIPRTYARATLHNLIVLGHESVHIEERYRFFRGEQFVKAVMDEVRIPASSGSLGEKWCTELLADAVFVRRFGPAALLVFADYAIAVGAIRPYTQTHPPGSFRLRLMWRVLQSAGLVELARAAGSPSSDVIAEVAHYERSGERFVDDAGLYQEVATAIERGIPAFIRIAEQFAPVGTYGPEHLDRVDELTEEFLRGVARSDVVDTDLNSTPVDIADLYNAAAAIRYTNRLDEFASRLGASTERPDGLGDVAAAVITLEELLLRAIEGVHVETGWPTP